MNQITAIQLATKATILAKATDCTIDEVIRYLAAVHATRCEVKKTRRCQFEHGSVLNPSGRFPTGGLSNK